MLKTKEIDEERDVIFDETRFGFNLQKPAEAKLTVLRDIDQEHAENIMDIRDQIERSIEAELEEEWTPEDEERE